MNVLRPISQHVPLHVSKRVLGYFGLAVRASAVHDAVKDGYKGFKVPESTDNWTEMVTNLFRGWSSAMGLV